MKEQRFNNLEQSENDENLILEGYAVVFDQETAIGDADGGFVEKIDRHALDNADLHDVCLRYNHADTFTVLARTRNKSLELKVDDHGLFIRAKLQKEVQSHWDIFQMVKAKLLDQMSFAFNVLKDDIKYRDGSSQNFKNYKYTRTVLKIGKLFDVSICDFGAYPTTEVNAILARSLELVETKAKALENAEQEKTLEKGALQLSKKKALVKATLLKRRFLK